MPSHKAHRFIDRLFLNSEREDVHRWIDAPYKYLGKKHRIMRHDPLTLIVKYHDDPEALASALLHILADEGVSRLRRRRLR
jgi:hypothetical protein